MNDSLGILRNLSKHLFLENLLAIASGFDNGLGLVLVMIEVYWRKFGEN